MDLLTITALIGALFLVPTAYAGLIGAPWAPTRTVALKKAFDDIGVGKEDMVVDLGAGDGMVLKEASLRGARAIGYELSPIMWIVGIVRTIGNARISMRYGNFFKKTLPHDATIIFLFLMPKHMGTVGKYLAQQPISNKAIVLSYAFSFQTLTPSRVYREKKCAPLYLYEFSSLKEHFDPVGKVA